MENNHPYIPADLRRRVLVEAGHRCAIPACRHIDVDIHHIIPWKQCQKHEYENLIALCPNCHRRAGQGKIDRKSLRIYKEKLRDHFGEIPERDCEENTINTKYTEKGTWSPSVQYTTGDSSKKYAQIISVDEAKYIFHQENVKVLFDFSVDLKIVPNGSALAIGGLPFTVDSRNIYEFKVRQTGLNHREDLTVSARRYCTWFDLLYITYGSEGFVRLWGFIVYDNAEGALWAALSDSETKSSFSSI